jgi:lipopolysaccharide transport system permease protein
MDVAQERSATRIMADHPTTGDPECQRHDSAVPLVRILPSGRWNWRELGELWAYRDLLVVLTTREVSVRYRQTAIGVGWVVLQPLLTVFVFTMIFGMLAGLPSEGLAYPIFVFAALLPWTYFAQALGRCATSLVADASLVDKVYFPRLILPLSATLAPLVDFAITLIILFGMLPLFGVLPSWRILTLPLFLLLAVASVMAFGLWLAALNVRYRDVGNVLPFLLQLWMYASPVAYPMEMVPARWRLLYALNPMASVIAGFRWALLDRGGILPHEAATGIAVVVVLLAGGFVYFGKAEETFVDLL